MEESSTTETARQGIVFGTEICAIELKVQIIIFWSNIISKHWLKHKKLAFLHSKYKIIVFAYIEFWDPEEIRF